MSFKIEDLIKIEFGLEKTLSFKQSAYLSNYFMKHLFCVTFSLVFDADLKDLLGVGGLGTIF